MKQFVLEGRNLRRDAAGFWCARGSGAELSYPSEGNDFCFEVEDGSFWFQHRNRALLAACQAFPPAGTFFDIGGGNGCVSAALERAGIPTVVVEPGPSGARNAVRRGLQQVVCARIEDAGFAPRSLSAAGLFDVIEHIENDRGFLTRLHDLMAPGGRVYITVPAHRWLWSYEDTRAGHFRRYTTRSLRRVLVEAGFEVEYGSYFFWLLPLPILLSRTLPSALGMRREDRREIKAREHAPTTGAVGRLMMRLLGLELGWIARGRALPVGTSCLAVARAANHRA